MDISLGGVWCTSVWWVSTEAINVCMFLSELWSRMVFRCSTPPTPPLRRWHLWKGRGDWSVRVAVECSRQLYAVFGTENILVAVRLACIPFGAYHTYTDACLVCEIHHMGTWAYYVTEWEFFWITCVLYTEQSKRIIPYHTLIRFFLYFQIDKS